MDESKDILFRVSYRSIFDLDTKAPILTIRKLGRSEDWDIFLYELEIEWHVFI